MKSEIKYIESKGLPVRSLVELALREGNSKLPVYRMHKWWARRLGSVVKGILLGMLLPGDTSENTYWDIYSGVRNLSDFVNPSKYTVLDPLMGGGSSLVESCRLKLNCVGLDLDPMAWFITKQELNKVDVRALEEAFNEIRKKVESKILRYYQTKTDSGEEKDVIYYFWVRTLRCPECNEVIELHPHYQLRRDRKKNKQTCFCHKCHHIHELSDSIGEFVCEVCGAQTKITKGTIDRRKIHCPNCGRDWPRKQLRITQNFSNLDLFALQYVEINDKKKPIKKFKKANESDLELFNSAMTEFDSLITAFPFMQSILDAMIPVAGREDQRPINYGFCRYSELFNARQLLCLAIILQEIIACDDKSLQEPLLLAFSDCLASNNMMCYYAFDYDKLTPLFGMHGYNMVTRPVENNVWGTSLGRGTFKNCFAKLLKGLHYMRDSGWPSNGTQNGATAQTNCFNVVNHDIVHSSSPLGKDELSQVSLYRKAAHQLPLADSSVDLILTDPPYFDNLNYGELSDFFYAWLRPILKDRYPTEFSPTNCVGIADRIHGNGDADSVTNFRDGLAKVFTECKRVLTDNGLMALTFHHKCEEPWVALSEALTQAGLSIVQIVPVRSEGRSGFHSAPGNLKWDAILVCRPSASISRHQMEDIDSSGLLQEWKQKLSELDGGPSEEDWHSLQFAFECFGRHTKVSGTCNSVKSNRIIQVEC